MSGGSTRLTHYEVLGVKKDCTQEQLKNAFLDLSKKYHPDMDSSDTKLHNKFIKINEAYSVLRVVDSRRAYDNQLRHGGSAYYNSQSMHRASPYPFRAYRDHYYEDENYARQRFYYDPSIDPQRRRRGNFSEDKYYGFKGIPRQSNFTIVAGCVIFVVLGSLVQFLTIMHGTTFRRSLLNRQSDQLAIVYGQTKKTAEQNGNEKQLEIIAQKLGHDFNDVD